MQASSECATANPCAVAQGAQCLDSSVFYINSTLTCPCPFGYDGDGYAAGTGCKRITQVCVVVGWCTCTPSRDCGDGQLSACTLFTRSAAHQVSVDVGPALNIDVLKVICAITAQARPSVPVGHFDDSGQRQRPAAPPCSWGLSAA